MHTKRPIIFTDLDGTLLDHHSYSYEPARPALNMLKKRNVPVVLCTSKTAAEVEHLHRELTLEAPFIVENGSAIIVPKNSQDQKQGDYFFGKKYEDILLVLHDLRRRSLYPFTGFADLSAPEVAKLTGLSEEQSSLAKQRLCSEPFFWTGDEKQRTRFEAELFDYGIKLLQGGRFYHAVDAKSGKGSALHWFMANLVDNSTSTHYFSVALGDGPNDEEMLEAADLAVIIPSLSGHSPAPRNSKILHATEPGPAGWNRSIQNILQCHFNSGE